MIRSAVFGLAGAVALISSANAADMYVNGGLKDGPAYDSWTFLYAGVHAGGAWADFTAVDVDGYVSHGATTAVDSSGLFGGAQVGKNFQRGQIVFGLEGDVGGMDLAIKKSIGSGVYGAASAELDAGLYADVTGRLGYLFAPNLLAYAKGGFAVYGGSFTADTVANGASTPSNTFIGWTLGGGLEYAVRSNWTIKAEYQFFDFGDQTVGLNNASQSLNGGLGYRFDAKDLTANAVSLGLNYRLSPASEPLK
jgi:outer membrane immunogenic protein